MTIRTHTRGGLPRPTYRELRDRLNSATEEELDQVVVIYDHVYDEAQPAYMIAKAASPPIPMGCFDTHGETEDGHLLIAIGK